MIVAGTNKAGQYVLAYSKDPALALPADEKERRIALDIARETQNFAAITTPGQQLTVFTMRRLPREQFVQWMETLDSNAQRRLGQMSWYIKLAKLALVRVENLTPGAKVRRVKDKDFGECADESVFDGIDPDLVLDILTDLGTEVFQMEQFTVPK